MISPKAPKIGPGGSRTGLALAVLGAIVVALPFFYAVAVSLSPPSDAFSNSFRFHFEWTNYVQIWSKAPFLRYFVNSAIVTGIVTLGTITTATLAAYAFARIRFLGSNLLFAATIATMMVPGHVTLIPNYLTMARFGLLDTFAGLVLPFLASGFSVFLLRQHFLSIPTELEDAARLDGAGSWTILWRIIVPMSRPAIGAAALYVFLTEWNSYLWPLIATHSDSMRTIQIGLARLANSGGGDLLIAWPVVMAAAVTVLVPTLAVFALAERQLVGGSAIQPSR